jgi:hypothetical protein
MFLVEHTTQLGPMMVTIPWCATPPGVNGNSYRKNNASMFVMNFSDLILFRFFDQISTVVFECVAQISHEHPTNYY